MNVASGPVSGDTADLAIIGGGPAGMMAALRARELGADVVLLEKNGQTGRKLLITGNGRCNIGNTDDIATFCKAFGPAKNFIKPTLHRFFTPDMIHFFGQLDLSIHIERSRFLYPVCGSAKMVRDALFQRMIDIGVRLKPNQAVTNISRDTTGVFNLLTAEKRYIAKSVIICTGGLSYPALGSTGDGYRLAVGFGHIIVNPIPSLTALQCPAGIASALAGLSLPNIRISLFRDNKKITSATGDLLFTHIGISGPLVHSISRTAVPLLITGQSVSLRLHLQPHGGESEALSTMIRSHPKRKVLRTLETMLPNRLAALLLAQTGIPADLVGSGLSSNQGREIDRLCSDFPLPITGYRPFAEAIVTAGGVSRKDVNPHTMQSRLVPGLFFAGEVLDIDGDTGGYNLTAAFSTGFTAGEEAYHYSVNQS